MATTPAPLNNTTLKDMKTLVLKQWGKKWNEPEIAYRFSNGREFEDSGAQGGPYTGTST
jgi:hypothetical protein